MKTREDWAIEYANECEHYKDAKMGYMCGAQEERERVLLEVEHWIRDNAWSFAHTSDGKPVYFTEQAIQCFNDAFENGKEYR